ncbi:DUF3991 and toprim domain-containing protein [Ruminococcaceae bacterium OttesenSCG-928-A11]|nr:DUF3991 and toprim domain-containing protein [Ruminococcaceae bacterium OttesenSCG-928-A11]
MRRQPGPIAVPGVSREQVAAARRVDALSWLQANEPDNLTHKNGEYRLRDHDSLTLSNGQWFWHSRGIGGHSALDFLVEVRGLSFVAAVSTLCDGRAAGHIPRLQPSPPPRTVRPVFRLPAKAANNRRVYAYLLSRGIGKDLIRRCIGLGILYESSPYHNAVFVGKDHTGTPRFACARGTLGNHRQDIAGSDKRFGFVLPAESPDGCQHIAVFESAIDALSHAEMNKEDCHRLSLAGTAPLALRQFLETTHAEGRRITRIDLCLDNDAAGLAGMDAIELMLREDFWFADISVTRDPPPPGLDYNEALLAAMREANTNPQDRQHDGGLSL